MHSIKNYKYMHLIRTLAVPKFFALLLLPPFRLLVCAANRYDSNAIRENDYAWREWVCESARSATKCTNYNLNNEKKTLGQHLSRSHTIHVASASWRTLFTTSHRWCIWFGILISICVQGGEVSHPLGYCQLDIVVIPLGAIAYQIIVCASQTR